MQHSARDSATYQLFMRFPCLSVTGFGMCTQQWIIFRSDLNDCNCDFQAFPIDRIGKERSRIQQESGVGVKQLMSDSFSSRWHSRIDPFRVLKLFSIDSSPGAQRRCRRTNHGCKERSACLCTISGLKWRKECIFNKIQTQQTCKYPNMVDFLHFLFNMCTALQPKTQKYPTKKICCWFFWYGNQWKHSMRKLELHLNITSTQTVWPRIQD